MRIETILFRITGRVQGVGFRYFVQKWAGILSITGWVRNTPEGNVEVLAEGHPAALIKLEAILRQGPPSSMVSEVLKGVPEDTKAIKPGTFFIRYGNID